MTNFISNFIEKIKKERYTKPQIYVCNDTVIMFDLLTPNRHRFVILINQPLKAETFDYLLEKEDCDYRNFRQRQYLQKINIDNLCCITDKNICIKTQNIYKCYNLEGILDVEDDDSESSDDINIKEYPVTNIYPAFQLPYFIKNIKNFENIISESYKIITKDEETQNEIEVKKLISLFEKQGKTIKNSIFEIHKKCFNIRRDIDKYTTNLDRIYKLRDKTGDSNDQILFKIDRLATETETQIDQLNKTLQNERNKADLLLKNYHKYITRFSQL